MAKRKRPSTEAMADVALAGAMRAAELADQSERERLTLRVNKALARALKHAAVDMGGTISEACEAALRFYFERHPPAGYQRETDADRTPAAALKRARELRRDGMNYAQAAEALNRDGYRTRRGQRWTGVNLQQRLRSKS